MRSWCCHIGSCVLLSLAACAQRSPSAASVTSAPVTSAPTSAAAPEGRAHALVLQAASCWLGGLWSDAAGDGQPARDGAIAGRCMEVIRATGESPATMYYPLRAVDAATVDKLAQRIAQTAREDPADRPHADALVAFFREVAAASSENLLARRAADRVKEAYAGTADAGERRADKNAAAPELSRSGALAALLQDGGAYAVEARVIGVLFAIDRFEIARGLPKHLKIACVEGVGETLFGVTAPRFSTEPAAPIPTGTWLGYLSAMASAAGHHVPQDAKDPQNREPLAWNGALQGLADQIRHVHTGTMLDAVSENVVARLDRQGASARASFDAHPAAAR